MSNRLVIGATGGVASCLTTSVGLAILVTAGTLPRVASIWVVLAATGLVVSVMVLLDAMRRPDRTSALVVDQPRTLPSPTTEASWTDPIDRELNRLDQHR